MEFNLINVTNISYMFSGCNSFVSFPDITNWNAFNIEKKNAIFYSCFNSIIIPNIIN